MSTLPWQLRIPKTEFLKCADPVSLQELRGCLLVLTGRNRNIDTHVSFLMGSHCAGGNMFVCIALGTTSQDTKYCIWENLYNIAMPTS